MSTVRATEVTKIYEQYLEPNIILAVRLDLAYQLYVELNKLTQNEKDHYIDMWKNVECFLLTILNVENVKLIDSLMNERMIYKSADIEYIPNKTPSMCKHFLAPLRVIKKTTGMWRRLALSAMYVDKGKLLTISEEMREEDEDDEIEMLLPSERDKDRVIIANNFFLRRTLDNKFISVDTKDNISHEASGLASFFITIKGEMLLFNRIDEMDDEKRVFSHSSYNNGGIAFFAGEIKIQNGELLAVGSHSGHYKPQLEKLYHCLKYFQEQGIKIKNTLVYSYEHRTQTSLDLQPIKNAKKLSHYTIAFNAYDLLVYFDRKLAEEKIEPKEKTHLSKNK